MDYLSLASELWKAIVAVPAFGVGIAVGAVGYKYLLKKNPVMLNKLVALAEAELQKVALAAVANASAVPSPVATSAALVVGLAEDVQKEVTVAPAVAPVTK
jgi:hypothetical protein